LVYGFGTTLGFKGFDVSAFFQGAGTMSLCWVVLVFTLLLKVV
jgi:hypothetical protein